MCIRDRLPTDPVTGKVVQNPWAFYPMFPMLTRAVMRVTGLDFYVAGGLLSTVVGAVAMVLLFRLVDRAAGRWSAIVATVATTTWVAAPVLQTDYSEACALLVIVLLLTALRGRRHWGVLVLLVPFGLTRTLLLLPAPPLSLLYSLRSPPLAPPRPACGNAPPPPTPGGAAPARRCCCCTAIRSRT